MNYLAHRRLVILMHDSLNTSLGKTGMALLRYCSESVVAVIDRQYRGQPEAQIVGIQHKIPIVASLTESLVYSPDILVIGIAPFGGVLPESWQQEIKQALAAGLSLVNPLHINMGDDPALKSLLAENQWIWDVRKPSLSTIGEGSGQAKKLNGLRVLTVGTDMSIGKMTTSLALNRVALARGLCSKFLATGQTGLIIGEDGIALDALPMESASGEVEQLILKFGNEYDILQIEGQGSLLHPASTATLVLMRGAQPTHLILVHKAGQTHLSGFPDFPIPPLPDVIDLYNKIAAVGNSDSPVMIVGISLNTGHLNEASALDAIAKVESETGLPCTDPFRFSADRLLDAVLESH